MDYATQGLVVRDQASGQDRARDGLSRKCGLPREAIAVCNSHNHALSGDRGEDRAHNRRVVEVLIMGLEAAFICLLAASLTLPAVGLGRDFEVRLWKGKEQDGVWGTEEFRASVNAQGVVRHVSVRGKELIWQAAALYTSPVPPGQTEGVRTVQGEGFGDRGLTLAAPEMAVRSQSGKREFTLQRLLPWRWLPMLRRR